MFLVLCALLVVFFFLLIKAEIVVSCEIMNRDLQGREDRTEKTRGAGEMKIVLDGNYVYYVMDYRQGLPP